MDKYETIKEKKIKKYISDISEVISISNDDLHFIEMCLDATWDSGAYYAIKQLSEAYERKDKNN